MLKKTPGEFHEIGVCMRTFPVKGSNKPVYQKGQPARSVWSRVTELAERDQEELRWKSSKNSVNSKYSGYFGAEKYI